jgi:hypothetical protein
MSVKLKELFILDLQKIAMEILLQIIPNTPKVVHNTPRSIRFRKISFSERDRKVISTYVPTYIEKDRKLNRYLAKNNIPKTSHQNLGIILGNKEF